MRIHYLQHVPFENPGSILLWAAANKYPVSCTKLYAGGKLPKQEEFDWLVIMGGPMNIYEEEKYPWLAAEKEFIKEAIHGNKVILGLCLGGQLIADVIGGRVIRNKYMEIGWFPVTMSTQVLQYPQFSLFPERPVVFEWHGDTFVDLPAEAQLIASNEACANQAFMYGQRTYGFQFHLENLETIIRDLIDNCAEEMVQGPYVQTAEEILFHREYIKEDNQLMTGFLNALALLYEKEEI